MSIKSLRLLPVLLCLAGYAHAGTPATHYPLTVGNCDSPQTFHQPPRRVVTLGQHETELLLALGLESAIVGTAVWFGPLPPQLAQAGQQLTRLADNAPGFEAVVARHPDLVLAQYSWHLGPRGEVATRERFAALGINSWVAPADCIGKTVTADSNGDGARTTPFTLDSIYREIEQLARIFNVAERGQALERQLAQRIASARQRAARPDARPLKVVYWFSSSRLNGDPWVAGRDGAPGWISRTLGLKNIIDSREEWPAVTWEHIARARPDVIVIADMARRLYPADSAAAKIAFLKSDPVTREIPAVKHDRLIVVPAMSLNPSLRNVDAVELIGERIARDDR